MNLRCGALTRAARALTRSHPSLLFFMALTPGLLLTSAGAFTLALALEAVFALALLRRLGPRQAFTLAALAALLLTRAAGARSARLEEVAEWRAQRAGPLVVEGTAEAAGPAGAGRTRVLFRVRGAGESPSTLRARSGWIRLFVSTPPAGGDATRSRPPLGRGVLVTGRFRPAPRPENPGTLGWGELPGGPRIRGSLVAAGWRDAGGGHSSPVQRAREALSQRVGELFPPLSGGFMQAALFGDREALAPRLREVFTRTGTGHIIAISGMNVAILAGVGWAALAPLVRATRRRRVVLCAALLVYVPLSGSSPSVARAAVMAVALLAAQAGARRVLLPNALGFAGLAVLLLQPEALLDPSFQLSFGAVAGLALLPDLPGRRWAAAAAGDPRRATKTVSAPRPEHAAARPTLPRPLRVLVGGAADLCVATVASLAATLPLTLTYFRHVSPASLPANLLVVPSLGALTAGGFAAIGASLVSPAVGAVYARACDLLLLGVFRALEWCAAPDWSWVALPGPRAALACGGAAVTILAGVALRVTRARRAALAGLATLLVGAPLLAGSRTPRILEVAVLAVGQGDAIVLLPPGGGAILVDGGPEEAAGSIVEFLHERGVRRLTRVIATHPDADHTGGLARVLAQVPADSVHDPGQWGAGAPYRRFLEASVATGAGYRPLAAGERLRAGELELQVLWPPRGFAARDPYWGAFATNDASVVLLGRYGAVRILLTGDAGAEVERALAARHGAGLRAPILKVGHHGSRSSSSRELLAAVRPRVALVSVGRDNRHGHPHAEVVERLRDAGVEVRRTDREGALLLGCAPARCAVVGHLSGRATGVQP